MSFDLMMDGKVALRRKACSECTTISALWAKPSACDLTFLLALRAVLQAQPPAALLVTAHNGRDRLSRTPQSPCSPCLETARPSEFPRELFSRAHPAKRASPALVLVSTVLGEKSPADFSIGLDRAPRVIRGWQNTHPKLATYIGGDPVEFLNERELLAN